VYVYVWVLASNSVDRLWYVCAGTQDAATDQYGHTRQAVIFLLLLHHRRYHVSRLDPGTTTSWHVHHWRQVSATLLVLSSACLFLLFVCLSISGFASDWVNYFTSDRWTEYFHQRVCLFFCLLVSFSLSVCLSACTSQKLRVQISPNFLYVLSVSMAHSCSDNNVISFLAYYTSILCTINEWMNDTLCTFSFLCMRSCFYIMEEGNRR